MMSSISIENHIQIIRNLVYKFEFAAWVHNIPTKNVLIQVVQLKKIDAVSENVEEDQNEVVNAITADGSRYRDMLKNFSECE